jgi:hypothetical protein
MTQVGISAILPVGVEVPGVRATVAVIVNALSPVDPEQRIQQGARPIFDELAAALEERMQMSECAALRKTVGVIRAREQ